MSEVTFGKAVGNPGSGGQKDDIPLAEDGGGVSATAVRGGGGPIRTGSTAGSPLGCGSAQLKGITKGENPLFEGKNAQAKTAGKGENPLFEGKSTLKMSAPGSATTGIMKIAAPNGGVEMNAAKIHGANTTTGHTGSMSGNHKDVMMGIKQNKTFGGGVPGAGKR
ncbi:MAG TPA: hypothetical protein V6D22_08555 [Candidatus Obscuribacterales bacterium]